MGKLCAFLDVFLSSNPNNRLAALLTFVIVTFPSLFHCENVYITVLTIGYNATESTSRRLYQCYPNASDASLEFGPVHQITSEPSTFPTPERQSSPENNPGAMFVTLSSSVVGVFYCNGTKSGHDATTVSTFFKRSNAKFVPSDGVFTKTVNKGDMDVVIMMTQTDVPKNDNSAIFWRKDNGSKISAQQGLTSYMYDFTNPIESTDEGVYEIYYQSERKRGGLFRLIVRDCPSGKWGPPSCVGVCDKCYNGGICDDKSGQCICPNNFKGPNCLTICRSKGGNRFGLSCEFQCTYRDSDGVNACHGYLFCLPDPYGCSCDVGVKGLGCQTPCSNGEFGAGCTQTCHCASGTCNEYTGECSGDCAAGWTGTNCQIPSKCDRGYYGSECTDKCHCLNDASCYRASGECPQRQCAAGYEVYDGQVKCQDCQGAFYGLHCSEACHCSETACDKVTGQCNGQCLNNWFLPGCQTGISRIDTNRKVFPGQPSSFTCHVYGDPPPAASTVGFYRVVNGSTNNTGISQSGNTQNGSERSIVFNVSQVLNGSYGCRVDKKEGVSLETQSQVYDLPVLAEPPSILNSTSTTVMLTWPPWTEAVSSDDPPLVSYSISYRLKSSNTWMGGKTVNKDVTSTTVEGLQPDTDYEFGVAAVRKGSGGTGPFSVKHATTLCGQPSSAPTPVLSTENEGLPKQLTVTWQDPVSTTTNCRSGFTHYVIYFNTATMPGSASPRRINNISLTEYILTGLETYVEYTVYMTAANKDAESRRSDEVRARTPEETAAPPINVSIPRSTRNSFTVSWSAAVPTNLNGNIMGYEIHYRNTTSPKDSDATVIQIDNTNLEVEHTIEGLPAETNYSVQVRTKNGVGNGNLSAPVYAKTVNTGYSSSSLIGGIVGGLFSVILIIVSIVIIIFLVRRCRQQEKDKSDTADNQTTPDTIGLTASSSQQGKSDNAVVYENVGLDYKEAENGVRVGNAVIYVNDGLNIEDRSSAGIDKEKPVKVTGAKLEIPPKPKPFAAYKREKLAGPPSSQHDDAMGVTGDITKMTPSKGIKTTPVDGEGDDDVEMEPESDPGEIYENVSIPVPILVADLAEYVKEKKQAEANSLYHEFNLFKPGQMHPWEVASKPENKAKNRFKNIIAYDHSRVVVEQVSGNPSSDYYNANHLLNYKNEKVFIASQAPNMASLYAFWRMVWNEEVATIVMLTNLVEGGKDRCRLYWPQDVKTSVTIGKVSIYLEEVVSYSDHVARKLIVHKTDKKEESKIIHQFHYQSWPDKDVPRDPTTLINFLRHVKQQHQKAERRDHKIPMLVHCSAGVGRTGTFICLYTMMDMMRDEGKVDVFHFVRKMREARIKMVQTRDQYVFIYDTLVDIYLSGNTEIPLTGFLAKLNALDKPNTKTRQANIKAEFETLKKVTPMPPAKAFCGASDVSKNRFPNIVPLMWNRPFLELSGSGETSQYINASFMDTFMKKDVLIVTQSPLPNTVVDIWRLVHDYTCPAIVMLNELDLSDKTCVQYWPDEGSIKLRSLNITSVAKDIGSHHVTRTFTVSSPSSKSEKTVKQFQLMGWNTTSNKPDSPRALLDLIDAVGNWVNTANIKGPVVVHCINGTGRSGVFCALWSVMEMIKQGGNVDIFQAVKRLRAHRPNMVETLDQYRLCYEVVGEYLRQFNEYGNLDCV